ncbi:MAG: endonuclease/exonuclease/phosphatase family protein, partial [Spirochaetales bacterium]
MTYNVHNLFDDQDDTTEYPEYRLQSGKWSTEQYLKKLENIAKVIKESCSGGPDFIALFEVENRRVLENLVRKPLDRMGYHTFAAVQTANSAISIGFVSRLPVVNYRSHQPPSKGFPQRPIVEVEVDCGGNLLTVFLCHFKSKSEGAEATEQNRVTSAEVIRRRMKELLEIDSSKEIVVLGDLNENIDEFDRVQGRYPTALIPLSIALEESLG